MSRGPGRIERAIRALFDAHPDLAFVTDELVEHCYPGVNQIERKHQVAVLRAARNVIADDPDWRARQAENQGHGWVFFNCANVQSYAFGCLICMSYIIYRSPKRIRRYAKQTEPICLVLKDREAVLEELSEDGTQVRLATRMVEQHITYRDGDAEVRAAMDEQQLLQQLAANIHAGQELMDKGLRLSVSQRSVR